MIKKKNKKKWASLAWRMQYSIFSWNLSLEKLRRHVNLSFEFPISFRAMRPAKLSLPARDRQLLYSFTFKFEFRVQISHFFVIERYLDHN